MRSVSGGSHAEQVAGAGIPMTPPPQLEPMYLIAESEMQQLKDTVWMLKGIGRYSEHMRQGIIALSRAASRPYQSSRDTVLDEINIKLDFIMSYVLPKSTTAKCNEKIEELHQKAGKP
jgi:hypothetical protein